MSKFQLNLLNKWVVKNMNSEQNKINNEPKLEINKKKIAGFSVIWNKRAKGYVNTTNHLLFLSKSTHKTILGFNLKEWIPVDEKYIELGHTMRFYSNRVSPSGHIYDTIIDINYYDLCKSNSTIYRIYLHPDCYCNTKPLLLELENYLVVIAPIEEN